MTGLGLEIDAREAVAMFNCVTLVGRLTRDAELGHLPDQHRTPRLRFTPAVDREYEVDGEIPTDFWPAEVVGDYGVRLAPHLGNGRLVLVQGAAHINASNRRTCERPSRHRAACKLPVRSVEQTLVERHAIGTQERQRKRTHPGDGIPPEDPPPFQAAWVLRSHRALAPHAVAEAIGLTGVLQDVQSVREPVQHGGRHLGVTEDHLAKSRLVVTIRL